MIYGYARVSSEGQKRYGTSLEEQEKVLRENGANVVYKDSYTGTKTERPQFSQLLLALKAGDTLMCTKLDRVSRSASQGIRLVDELLAKGVSVHILNLGVMDDTPTGKLIRNIMFSFAEFERDMIVMRTEEGKSAAKAKNPEWREGRKRLVVSGFEEMKRKVDGGEISVSAAVSGLGISRSKWYSMCRE